MNATFITESLISYLNTKQPKYLVDNFYYSAWWEMDLVQVTRTDLINEYEIKTSKSDFNADFKYISFIKFSLTHQKLRA